MEKEFDFDLEAATLTADTANTMIDWVKAQPKPWQLMSYDEQMAVIEAANKLAKGVVRDAVHAIAAEGRKVILAKVEKVEFVEKGIKATLSAAKTSEYRHELSDSRGLEVMLVVADVSEFTGGELRQPDAREDNQEHLPFDDDDKPVFDNTRAAAE